MNNQELLQLIKSIKESTMTIMNKQDVDSSNTDNQPTILE